MSDDNKVNSKAKVHSKTAQNVLGGVGALNKAAGGVTGFAGGIAASITGGKDLTKEVPDLVGEATSIGMMLNKKGVKSASDANQKESVSPDATPNSQEQSQNQTPSR